ncbi:VOC family protein [Dactylosporangium sp. CA-139066]|uniref:VOC family protein n=1 Tax=Dactylosporangium sp. CA-139066 TaxID=3239930 RepID=UPI003D94C5A6
MRQQVEALVPVLYVADVDRAKEFYALFGFAETSSGSDGASRWLYLHAGELTMLIAAVQPQLITVELPLLIYIFVDDLDTTMRQLQAAGHTVDLAGYPDHAPGGEARTKDPDGNVVLFGQRSAVAEDQRRQPTGAEARFSLIRRAAEAIEQRGGAPERCQIGQPNGDACSEPAEVKLTDSWGDAAWSCASHAEETLLRARGAFIAIEDGEGLGPFLRRRRAAR